MRDTNAHEKIDDLRRENRRLAARLSILEKGFRELVSSGSFLPSLQQRVLAIVNDDSWTRAQMVETLFFIPQSKGGFMPDAEYRTWNEVMTFDFDGSLGVSFWLLVGLAFSPLLGAAIGWWLFS